MKARTLLWVFAALNLSDLLTTLYVLDAGLGTEANPLALYFLAIGGGWALATWKLSSVLLYCGVMAKYWEAWPIRAGVWVTTSAYGVLAAYQYYYLLVIWSAI